MWQCAMEPDLQNKSWCTWSIWLKPPLNRWKSCRLKHQICVDQWDDCRLPQKINATFLFLRFSWNLLIIKTCHTSPASSFKTTATVIWKTNYILCWHFSTSPALDFLVHQSSHLSFLILQIICSSMHAYSCFSDWLNALISCVTTFLLLWTRLPLRRTGDRILEI